MKATVRLTMDGLIRALRAVAHDLADDAERGYGPADRLSGRVVRTERPIAFLDKTKEPAGDRASR